MSKNNRAEYLLLRLEQNKMWFLRKRNIKFNKKLPKTVVKWIELQTNRYESIVYLVENEIKENGFRDVATDEKYLQPIEKVMNNK